MAEILSDFILMMDSLVQDAYKDYCRTASGLDFTSLTKGVWVDQSAFNKYMSAVKEKGGFQGARIVGTKVAPKLQELFKTFDGVPSLGQTKEFFAKAYLNSNRGADVGYYDVAEVKDHEATVITTSKLDPDFHLGVFEGCARIYKKWVTKSEIVETLDKNGRYVFKYHF
jgi:hypothetical protein